MEQASPVPEKIRTFLHHCVDSVEQLEVLARLSDSPEKEWTVLSLSQDLRSTEGSVEKRLRDLATARVIQPITSSAFRFQPCSPEMARTVAEVTKFYRTHPYRVIDLLFSKPVNAMQTFADAFRFKKEDS